MVTIIVLIQKVAKAIIINELRHKVLFISDRVLKRRKNLK